MNKEIDVNKLVTAVRYLNEHENTPLQEIHKYLDENEMTWTFKDAESYAAEHNTDDVTVGDGFPAGDIGTAIMFVANARGDAIDWGYCREFIACGDISKWLDARAKIDEFSNKSQVRFAQADFVNYDLDNEDMQSSK